jgi:hypothetical protein
MKKTVLTFGLIAGVLMAGMMGVNLAFVEKIGFDKGEIVGYSTMVVSFLMVFFGIRSYRENVGNGRISFARAFAVGIFITIVATLCYVAVWEFVYIKFFPDFFDKYANYIVEKLRASGASQQVVENKIQELKNFKVMYDNPLMNAMFTFLEPFPVGLVITLISAAILRKK